MSSWLDGFLAVPTIGIQTKPNFNAFFNYPQVLIPLLDRLTDNNEEFDIERDDFDFVINSSNGLAYNFAKEKIVIGFKYAIDPIEEIGKFPRIPDVDLKPYSDLVFNSLIEAKSILKLFDNENQLQIKKLTIAVSLKTDFDSVPPGIKLFLEYLSQPWNNPINRCRTQLVTSLSDGKSSSHEDHCLHHISFDKTEEPVALELSLVWERVLKKNIKSMSSQLDKLIDNCGASALAYFQSFGEGNYLDYE